VKVAPARTSATRCGAFTARQRVWADSMSLNAIATPAAREPGPLVTRCRNRTVAKVDSIGVRGSQVDPVLGRVVVELQQHVEVLGDLLGGLGPLDAVVGNEGPGRSDRVFAVFGVVDLGQRGPRAGTESRRYIGLEILAACRKTAQPDMGQNVANEAGLTIEAIPA
jgi:hypothetical protein